MSAPTVAPPDQQMDLGTEALNGRDGDTARAAGTKYNAHQHQTSSVQDALDGAASPSASNVYATMTDVSGAVGTHADNHTDGTDDIQDATASQKGLMTAAYATKVDGIETAADVTGETNVIGALSGASVSSATVATGDKVLIQDADDSDGLKTVTAQSIADLAASGVTDAADLTYTPAVAADWDSDTDPGDTDEALDQLAERVTDIEEAGAGGVDGPSVILHFGTDAASQAPDVDITDWTEVEDSDSAFATGVFTVPPGKAGKYMINFNLRFTSASGVAALIKTTDYTYWGDFGATTHKATNCQIIAHLDVGDTVSFQLTGATPNVDAVSAGGAILTYAMIQRIGT